MVRNAADLDRQIHELLIEARADVQARDLAPIAVDLVPLVEMIAKAYSSVSPAHEVVADVPEGIVAWADPAPLYQVLGHVLDNAIKYSPAGGTIRIHVTKTPEEVQIDVIDEGVGIPEDVEIFEPFQRGEQVGDARGIGLGLHIVRNLLGAMGGSVSARRNRDRGSTFTLHVPHAP
jgi:signal transduction histidine kinase